MAWMIIRVRGSIHAKHDIVQTLESLHLTRANHATVVPESPAFRGMITKVNGYVTWGEADAKTVAELLGARGQRPGGGLLTEGPDGAVATLPDGLAERIGKNGIYGEPAVRPLFRLKPPRGGWRSTKKPFTLGGALGYRGAAINDLARKML
jgi:large subunit ribosomal protein L30